MKKYSVQEVFELLGADALMIQQTPKGKNRKQSIEVEGFSVYRQSLRYATFYQKGLKCACCGKEGTHFLLDSDRNGESSETRRHFNLYADDGTLMTKDHVRPRKWGGKDTVDNMQTMCEPCNKNKGSVYDDEIDCIVGTRIDTDEEAIIAWDVEDAAYKLCIRNHILSVKQAPGKLAKHVIHITVGLLESIDTDNVFGGLRWKTCRRKVEGHPYNG